MGSHGKLKLVLGLHGGFSINQRGTQVRLMERCRADWQAAGAVTCWADAVPAKSARALLS